MDVIEVLREDHKELERLLVAVLTKTGYPKGYLEAARELFSKLGQHEWLEETAVFPALRAASTEARECLDFLSGDHRRIHDLSKKMREALDRSDTYMLGHTTAAFADFLRSHWRKEEQLIFPLALRVLSRSYREDLALLRR